MKNTPKKKTKRKYIFIQKSELVKSDRKTRYKKWQRLISKWIGVEPSDNFNYLYRIEYKGTRGGVDPKHRNILVNEDGEFFIVLKEENRIAMIVTTKPSVHKPRLHGRFFIVEKPKKAKPNLKKE